MPDPVDILVVDDEELICFVLTQLLRVHGYAVRTASRGEEALAMIGERIPSLVILDIRMPGISGFEVLHHIRSMDIHIPVILMTALSGVRDAVDAMKGGAFDYVAKPFDNNAMIATVERALRSSMDGTSAHAATEYSIEEETPDPVFLSLGPSTAARQLARSAHRLAREGKPCLLLGEVGSGKHRLARLMHDVSGRPGSLVETDCTGAAESLIRHELYGGGTATGPATRGKLQFAHDGTLVIRGTEDMTSSLQEALARDVRMQFFVHPSTGARIDISARLIMTAMMERTPGALELTRDLLGLIEERIVGIPPLRERREDIPYLVGCFIEETAEEFDRPVRAIDDAALELLMDYDWPGNVHELKSLIRRAVLGADERIRMKDIDLPVPGFDRFSPLPGDFQVTGAPLKEQVRRHVAEIERDLLLQMLRYTEWNKSRASRLLGITYKTMLKKVAEYGLERPGTRW